MDANQICDQVLSVSANITIKKTMIRGKNGETKSSSRIQTFNSNIKNEYKTTNYSTNTPMETFSLIKNYPSNPSMMNTLSKPMMPLSNRALNPTSSLAMNMPMNATSSLAMNPASSWDMNPTPSKTMKPPASLPKKLASRAG